MPSLFQLDGCCTSAHLGSVARRLLWRTLQRSNWNKLLKPSDKTQCTVQVAMVLVRQCKLVSKRAQMYGTNKWPSAIPSQNETSGQSAGNLKIYKHKHLSRGPGREAMQAEMNETNYVLPIIHSANRV